jgi:hypothetical protein
VDGSVEDAANGGGVWGERARRPRVVANHTPYQQNIIRRYYQNFDAIQHSRLSELMAEAYLTEGKARDRVWKRIEAILVKLEFPPQRIAHLLSKRDASLLPGILKELEGK